jgi:release factor glutamine methyltransferase
MKKKLTIHSVLQMAYETLKDLDSGHLDAEILLSRILGVPRSYLYAHAEQVLATQDRQQFAALLLRRKQGEPIAYLTGHQEFWSLDLDVTPATLIPRPETELLVQLALTILPGEGKLTIADLGVGSGAVAIALATERPQWEVHATDYSQEALQVVARNIQKYGLSNIVLVQGDWCEGLPRQDYRAIVSNPPYIAEKDSHLPALCYEPKQALVAGSDGLLAIRKIVSQAKHYLAKNGWLLLEHGYDQGEKVVSLLQAAGYCSISDYQDLAGNPRVVAGCWL